jgi:hypothetical protein
VQTAQYPRSQIVPQLMVVSKVACVQAYSGGLRR